MDGSLSSSANSHLASLCADQAPFGSRLPEPPVGWAREVSHRQIGLHGLHLDGLSYVFLAPFDLDVYQFS